MTQTDSGMHSVAHESIKGEALASVVSLFARLTFSAHCVTEGAVLFRYSDIIKWSDITDYSLSNKTEIIWPI